jgi:predicted membrane-bound spermidine synthase
LRHLIDTNCATNCMVLARRPTMIPFLCLIFVLSGAAGLIYESIWTRYLGLFVGHDAYAQILVLVIFLGGMSLGAMLMSQRSERVRQPLYGYVAVEFAVGCIGLVFHDFYQVATGWAYASLFPGLAGTWELTAAKWTVAGALILPQSVLLGMTFPLMSAGVLRLVPDRPGRTLSLLYFANSLGAAVGVLVAGFYLVGAAGLPGTLAAAAALNLAVAASTMGAIVLGRTRVPAPPTPAVAPDERVPNSGDLPRLLLFASFATAVASFIYEIAWIRMLALVLGSATHAFELMLSAFILGLALGAWCIRSRADRLAAPLRTLGIVQWVMGALALATLPIYIRSFGWTADLIAAFSPSDAGYTGYTIARYALCLAIMLPATVCAGMTLPLITRILLGLRTGERAIGAVYGWNTLGSIAGVILGGLVLLPAVGLHALLILGALVDMAVGIVLLRRAGVGRPAGRLVPLAVGATLAVAVVAWGGVRFDRVLLSSGVYRSGELAKPNEREVRYYRDGRTATVTAAVIRATRQLYLATNGKTDASLSADWQAGCDATRPTVALSQDGATQVLLPLITMAYAPQARSAAVIGQGSGMSSHLMLASPAIRNLVTIEIEPQMVAGSRIFYPFNRRAFDDPRSHLVIDDAKSYFASASRQFDLIMSEPSNPWVSGVSGLFTTEFYQRVRTYLTEDGVFGQWLHLYALDDDLVLSVIAALHQNFPSYEIYLVPSGDLLVVASNRPKLPAPDWSVLGLPALRADLCRFRPLDPATVQALHLAGRRELAPLLNQGSVMANSDFFPVLDLGAERRRFRHDFAVGFPALSADWFNLLASMRHRPVAPATDPLASLPENPRVRARATGALLRTAAAEGRTDTIASPADAQAVFLWQQWRLGRDRAPSDWEMWTDQVSQIAANRDRGSAGMADDAFYADVQRTMDRFGAPAAARDVVRFRRDMAAWRFSDAAAAADRLLPVAMQEHRWITADELRDGAVFAKLNSGDVRGARQVLDTLARFSVRRPNDLRSRLLAAYVTSAELQRAMASAGPTGVSQR